MNANEVLKVPDILPEEFRSILPFTEFNYVQSILLNQALETDKSMIVAGCILFLIHIICYMISHICYRPIFFLSAYRVWQGKLN